MKTAVSSLLLLATIAATGCTTLANRRDLFRPNEAKGPYTEMLDEGLDKPRVKATSENPEPAAGGAMHDQAHAH